jgi:nucleoside-diphosphate-sugar epimerase
MRVLLTGVSSFTGLWFARALKAAGCEVVAPLRASTYDDPLRQARIAEAAKVAEVVPAAPFGSEAFLQILKRGFDVLCHHAAEAANHKSPDFDVARAVAGNTLNAAAALRAAQAAGVQRLVLTGSAFEEDEGRGTLPLTAFSPYGLSKTLTARAFQAECDRAGLPMVKFIVPNPFGAYEGQTFQRAVMTRWSRGEGVHVSHPFYGRDNAPVDLLGQVYARAAAGSLGAHVSPSVYAGAVGDFFKRMQRETRARTGWACAMTLAESQDSKEPLERYNLQPVQPSDYGWSESAFWDAYAAYYAEEG